MLDNLEALTALADKGTMGKAALALHITQSAVSKRIANLEYQLKQKLISPHGRKVELTPAGLRLLEKARPLMGVLKESVIDERAEASGVIELDISVSVLISWGATALAKVRESLPGIELKVSSHHASVAVERVRSGESMVAIVQGASLIAPELSAQHLIDQEMVIVPSGLKPFKLKKGMKVPILAIEDYTEAWRFIEKGMKANCPEWGITFNVTSQMQGFTAITQMARAGFGNGLVPRGVARTLGVTKNSWVELPKPGLSVPISLVGRRTTLGMPLVNKFHTQLAAILKKVKD